MREIVFDTETTGLNFQGGDRLVEIGCVELFNRNPTGAVFHAYFNPGRTMPAEAEAIHGLSTTFLAAKPRFAELVDELVAFLGDAPLVAHNASFDFGFVNWELSLLGLPPLCVTRMVDTHALAKTRHPGAKLTLDALCTRYGVDRSHRVKHGALVDAQLLAEVYVELTGGRQIGFMLADAAADAAVTLAAIHSERPVRPARPHGASAVELQRHRAFVATLSDPLWVAVAAG